MQKYLHSKPLYIGITTFVILGVFIMMYQVGKGDTSNFVTTEVDSGLVRQLVSVSGIAKADQSAELAFPVAGIVRSVNVKTGDSVAYGDILITLDDRSLQADRQSAAASVAQAVASRNELLAGPTNSARDVTSETVASALQTLATTKDDQARKITNAYQTLLSSDLAAYSLDSRESATPPTITGTYTCDQEGAYTIDIYSSNADSGYSYRLSGLETGTFTASTKQPLALGTCGLRVLFNSDSSYNNSEWTIDIPNTKSPFYITNRNAYTLATTQADGAIKNAEQAVAFAQAQATDQNAPIRTEALARADATVTQAQSQLAKIDAALADRVLRAPFTGTITSIDILPGETVSTLPAVTLLARSDFEITARIPEIDISKLVIGQPVEMDFDAKKDTLLLGKISFINLQATEIDGVSYYEAIIQPDSIPEWMRSGLTADIDIIISEVTSQARIPTRFLTKTTTGYAVLVQTGKTTTATTTVEIELEGNDGYVSITGINQGDILVAP